ncbi:hypothetical protein CPB86DRAFT_792288 [Serendipita vermifera]|nr:hypothetical protein CPB86DRAFT_792288 [Serendipita vermifera]
MSSYEEPTLRSSQKGANRMTGQSRLPNEILIPIIQFVHRKKELYNLCLSNSFNREIATPILYLHHFGASRWAKKPNLYILTEHPRFEYMVNTFTIYLSSLSCKSQGDGYSSSSSLCSCLTLNKRLGTILIGLRNLKVLDIDCDLYHGHGRDQHQYFVHLKTRVLQQLWFVCQCCGIGEVEMIKIMGSPCMQSVTSLDWNSKGNHSRNNNHFESFLKDTNALPNLQELHHNGSVFDDLLLRHRPIRRLRGSPWCDSYVLLNRGDLQRRNILLTHLILRGFEMGNPFGIIEQDPNPLRNLRHIGTFSYSYRHDVDSALLEDLGRCARLSKLVSFDAFAQYAAFTFVEKFMENHSGRLLTWFPNLRKVFFRHLEGTSVWVRSDQGWECRGRNVIMSITDIIRDWEVLHEKCINDGCTENVAAIMGRLED